MQRLFYNSIVPFSKINAGSHADIANALNMHSSYSLAMCSEKNYSNQNYRFVYENIVKNDIPKVYIAAYMSEQTEEEVRESLNYFNSRNEKAGLKKFQYDDNYIKKYLESCRDRMKTMVYPFAESLGNCEVKLIPGDHTIYIHRPDDVIGVVSKFLEEIEQKKE